jgi:diadenosine tetraphosphatase ApaH/serine/threonine PP2A family protein phosphatase
MRIAFLFDIHANLPALGAALGAARMGGFDTILHGGDLIGWGPQPNEVVASIGEERIAGIAGNHEFLCLGAYAEQHPLRNQSTRWTSEQLTDDTRGAIEELPPKIAGEGFLLAHSNPTAWCEPPDVTCFPYVHGTDDLIRQPPGFPEAPGAIVTGHVHEPAVYVASLGGLALERRFMERRDNCLEVVLAEDQSAFVVAGAVGKPRDGVPAANYVLLDTSTRTIALRRVAYDVEPVCRMLREAEGLPAVLADQLAEGT